MTSEVTLLAQLHWTAVGAFWVSVVLTVVAVVATFLNYLVFLTQVDPHVIVYASTDGRRPSMILLVVENIGKGVAKNVRFEFSEPIPERAYGFEDAPEPKEMTSGPLIEGIPALGPGAKRVVTWGQYGGLQKGIGDRVIDVTVVFEADRFGPFEPEEKRVVCALDVKSFKGTDDSDQNWDRKAAEHLKSIAETLQKSRSLVGHRVEIVKEQDDAT